MIELTLIDLESKILLNPTLLISVQDHTRGSVVTMHGGAKPGVDFKNYFVEESYADIKKLLTKSTKTRTTKTTS